MHLNPQPFIDIKSGIKTIEARINDEKRQSLKVEDYITFINREQQNEKIYTQITKISLFKSFNEMFKELGTIDFGYDPSISDEDAVKSISKYYSHEEVQHYGVIGIHIKLINPDKMPQ